MYKVDFMGIGIMDSLKGFLRNESRSMLPKILLKANLHTVSCMMIVTDLSTKQLRIVHYQSKAFLVVILHFTMLQKLSKCKVRA